MKLHFLLMILLASSGLHAQNASISIIDSSRDCSIRGMSIPKDEIVWLSGSKGHVGRSVDGGKSWRWTIVAGYEKSDFRDIQGFDSATSVIMGIGDPAHILKTVDGGRTWKPVFTKAAPGMFLDAMDFRNRQNGICIGDPLPAADGTKRFYILRTSDAGDTWQEDDPASCPAAQEGEAVFSASGSNIALLDGKVFNYAFISGGTVSNLHFVGKAAPGQVLPLKIVQGKESAGAFSMATDRKSGFYIVGGDYKEPAMRTQNFIWTENAGKVWNYAPQSPGGYRSCIAMIDSRRLVACGPNGVDICGDPSGWRRISDDNFNVCAVSPNGKTVFFAGSKGRVGMLRLR